MSEAFIEKNVRLSTEFDNYLVKHPELFEYIPNGAYVVITLSDDSKFNTVSRSLIKNKKRKKIVEAYRTDANSWEIRSLQVI